MQLRHIWMCAVAHQRYHRDVTHLECYAWKKWVCITRCTPAGDLEFKQQSTCTAKCNFWSFLDYKSNACILTTVPDRTKTSHYWWIILLLKWCNRWEKNQYVCCTKIPTSSFSALPFGSKHYGKSSLFSQRHSEGASAYFITICSLTSYKCGMWWQ